MKVCKIATELHMKMEPVAIQFTDTRPEKALQFKEGSWGCVGAMLVAAGKGKTAVFDEKSYGCRGGGVGLGFGDTFQEHPIECLLSTGDEAVAQRGIEGDFSFGKGERFFATPELAERWKKSLPYGDVHGYIVFCPLHEATYLKKDDLICFFVNPDQISALITLVGFQRGTGINVIAPFGAACQSILYAYQEAKKDEPQAVLGFFDISQRPRFEKDLLSFTVPFSLFQEMEESVSESLFCTEAWGKVATRL